MDDEKIVELFWERSESAITETAAKYARYCHRISYNILGNNEDADECVNDTYLGAWDSMPPHKPFRLSTLLGKITRNISLNRYKNYNAEKRGFGQTALTLSELEECIPANNNVGEAADEMVLVEAINKFLLSMEKEKRKAFIRRYWYLCSIKSIAEQHGISESKTASMLFRMRKELRTYLEKEGIYI